MNFHLVLRFAWDALVLLILAALVLLTGFGTSFALEESYSDWPMRPGMRVMPPAAVYAGFAVIAALIISIFWRRLRRLAIIAGALMIIGYWLLFYLITNDIIISRASNYG